MFRIQRKNRDFDIGILNKLSEDLTNAITNSKLAYYRRIASKLNDPNSAPKTYWSILKSFVNGKKIPLIPPILVKDQLVTNFLEKANLFNEFFRSLDPNKAHGHDGIFIRMLKLCTSSISKPSFLLFKHSLENECFPNEWKKANIVPIHKKGDKQLIQNDRPVSLLPICGKISEKIIFNSLFKYLENNNLLNPHQSGFRPGDSCVHQLLSITYGIYKSFDANPSLEVRGIFRDMSKAFDRVWHEGLLFELKRLGLSGKYYGLIKSFLRNRHQRVVLNGQSSKWSSIKAGVSQGSIIGALLFLVYINDLPNGLLSNPKLFVDDTSIFSVVKDHLNSSNKLNEDLSKISQWAYQWKISFNPDVSKQAQEVIFSRKKNISNHPAVFFNNLPINRKSTQKHLGLLLDEKLIFSEHINEKLKKVTKSINLLRKLNLTLPRSSLLIIYKSFIRSHLDYGDIVDDQPNNSSLSEKIESLQYNAALAITGAIKGSSKGKLYQELGFESLKDRRWMRNVAIYTRSYNQSDLPISMICYLHYKDLNESKVSFSNCCVERKSSKTPFYRIR